MILKVIEWYFNIDVICYILKIKVKMTEVQHQLQDLKSRLDTDSPEEYSHEERALMNRVEELKEEFKELLSELRRKKAGEGAIMSDDVRRLSYVTWLIYTIKHSLLHIYHIDV